MITISTSSGSWTVPPGAVSPQCSCQTQLGIRDQETFKGIASSTVGLVSAALAGLDPYSVPLPAPSMWVCMRLLAASRSSSSSRTPQPQMPELMSTGLSWADGGARACLNHSGTVHGFLKFSLDKTHLGHGNWTTHAVESVRWSSMQICVLSVCLRPSGLTRTSLGACVPQWIAWAASFRRLATTRGHRQLRSYSWRSRCGRIATSSTRRRST